MHPSTTAPSHGSEHDPVFLDREYNARAGIPDAPAILERWAERAAATRTTHPPRELAFGDAPAERIDLFLPPASGDARLPLLVFIHGGYWRSLDKSDFSWMAEPFLARGVAVALLNHALLPQADMDTIARQSSRALACLHRRADALGLDATRFVVAGHSAGGHLCALAATVDGRTLGDDLPDALAAAVLPVSPLADLEPLRHAPFIRRDLSLDAASAARLSPANARPRAGLRAVIAVGELESGEFHRQAALLRERWGGTVEAVLDVAGRHHLDVCDALAEPGHPLHEAALDLLGLPTGDAAMRAGRPDR